MMIGGMAKQWITAAKALAVVAEHSSPNQARLALCSRAHESLAATKARLVTFGNQRREDAPVPAKFWWARGHEALTQNWPVGDFSTWIDNKVEWKSFGVLFDLEGVLAMIPGEHRASHRISLSVVGNPAWVPASAARQRVARSGAIAGPKAGNVLIDNCRLGFVSARATLMQRADSGRVGDWSHQEREWDVPVWFWTNFVDLDSLQDWDDWHESPHDWERGVFAGEGDSATGSAWITLTSTHFHKDGLEALYQSADNPKAPELSGSSPEARTAPSGRPPASFWDELWCAVWGQIYRGDLKPKLQADVEKAMLDWATARGHEPGTSTIRPRARMLFRALQE